MILPNLHFRLFPEILKLMSKELGFVPLLLLIPVLILLTSGTVFGAYYYSQNKLPVTSVQNSATKSNPSSSPVPSISSKPLSTPLPSTIPSPAIKIQTPTDDTLNKPKCGIIFETSFDVFVQKGDTASTISNKLINQYLEKAKLSAAKDNIPGLTSEENLYAQNQIQKSLALNGLEVGQKITAPCTVVENACIAARETTRLKNTPR